MKKEGSLKIVLSILVIILITLVSIWGVYKKAGIVMKNRLPDYKYGMELDDTNLINIEVQKEETTTPEVTTGETTETAETTETTETTEENGENTEKSEEKKEDVYTVKNYRKAKEIIEKRLKLMDVEQYTIRLDEGNGSMAIEVPTELSSLVSQNAFATGKLEIKIDDNGEIIGDNKSIQDVKTRINKDYANVKGAGMTVELTFVFTKEATKKFTDIKNNYDIFTQSETTETETTEGTDPTALTDNSGVTKRYITFYLDGSSIYSKPIDEIAEYGSTGTLPLSIGGYTHDNEEIEQSLKQANITKSLILTENLPIKYTTTATTSTIHSDISKKSIAIVATIAVLATCAYLIVKYKLKGVYGSLAIIGFISSLLLVVRFSNIVVTISSIFSIALMAILQFIYIAKILNGNTASKKFNEKTMDFVKIIIPIFLMSIAISFAKTVELNGFGEVIFWGILVFVLFNNILTRAMLTNAKNK